MKPRFPVPVSWLGLEPRVTVDFRADTTVLHSAQPFPDIYRVVPVEDRRYATPKLYRIEQWSAWGGRWHPWETIRPCRLANLSIGSHCLIEVKIGAENQVVVTNATGNHATWRKSDYDGTLLCEGGTWKDASRPAFYGRVTCPDCLKIGKAWLPFRVEDYEHPRVTEKVRRKAQNKARIRAKYPTVFDRLSSDFLDD